MGIIKGRILKINLSEKKVYKEELSEEMRKKLIGGKGFGIYLNIKINSTYNPLSPENSMIFVLGPGAGTILPTAVRMGLYGIAPLNNVGLESTVGGDIGHFVRKAGYDVIIISGKASKPVYIKIFDDDISIENAEKFWGKDIYQTEEELKSLYGKDAQILTIGPAGEKLVRFACISHKKHRHFGRMGSGALMGSKLVKAIVIKGTGKVAVYDEKGLKNYVRNLNKRVKENPVTGKVYPLAGTVNFVAKANLLGVFPSHYWVKGEARYRDRLDFEYIQKTTLVKQVRCYGCPIGCAHINRIPDGNYCGIELDGPEFETIYAFGGLCDFKDIRDIIYINDICDRLGIDTMHTGNLIGLLMYGTDIEKVPDEFKINFGDTKRCAELIHRIVERRGNYYLLGEGIKTVAQELNLEDWAIHVKGLEPAGYDPRGVQSMAITYGISNRGATHQSSNSYARDISGRARDFELNEQDKSLKRLSLDKKAELVFNMINFNAIADCFILCRFINRDLLTWEDYTEMLYLLTGVEKSREDLQKLANDMITAGRIFNLNRGLSSKDDILPDRFYTEPLQSEGSNGAKIDYTHYITEVKKYYSMRNWDANGVPLYTPFE